MHGSEQKLYKTVISQFLSLMSLDCDRQQFYEVETALKDISEYDCFSVFLPCVERWFDVQRRQFGYACTHQLNYRTTQFTNSEFGKAIAGLQRDIMGTGKRTGNDDLLVAYCRVVDEMNRKIP